MKAWQTAAWQSVLLSEAKPRRSCNIGLVPYSTPNRNSFVGPRRDFPSCYNSDSLPHNDLLPSYELLDTHARIGRVMLYQGCAGSRTAVSG